MKAQTVKIGGVSAERIENMKALYVRKHVSPGINARTTWSGHSASSSGKLLKKGNKAFKPVKKGKAFKHEAAEEEHDIQGVLGHYSDGGTEIVTNNPRRIPPTLCQTQTQHPTTFFPNCGHEIISTVSHEKIANGTKLLKKGKTFKLLKKGKVFKHEAAEEDNDTKRKHESVYHSLGPYGHRPRNHRDCSTIVQNFVRGKQKTFAETRKQKIIPSENRKKLCG